MPARFLPNSHAQRTTALDGLYNKGSTTPAPSRLFSQEDFDLLLNLRPQWKALNDAAALALNIQTQFTDVADAKADILEMFLSHFIQVFNLGVKRGKYSANERASYKLDVTSSDVPPILSHADREKWAQNIAAGETARQAAAQAAGTVFKPMANPDAAEVAAAYADYLTAHRAASDKKDAYDDAQKAVENKAAVVDPLILNAWDTIEYNLRHETPPSLRRKAREYGVVYITRPGETPDPDSPTPPAPTPPNP